MKKSARSESSNTRARKGTRVANKRSSVGNAKGRSQRSVKSAERRSVGSMSPSGRASKNFALGGKPRSQRLHSGRARKKQGISK